MSIERFDFVSDDCVCSSGMVTDANGEYIKYDSIAEIHKQLKTSNRLLKKWLNGVSMNGVAKLQRDTVKFLDENVEPKEEVE